MSFCLWIIFSRLSSLRQMFEIDSLSFCTVLESLLVVVMELVSLELDVTDAQVLLLVKSEFQVWLLDVSDRLSTELIAYCKSGVVFEHNGSVESYSEVERSWCFFVNLFS